MIGEAILVGTVAGTALALLWAALGGRESGRRSPVSLLSIFIGVFGLVVIYAVGFRSPVVVEEQIRSRPVMVLEGGDGYVSSDKCAACHPSQYDTWHESYHRTMTQVASPETVIPDLDGLELSLFGNHYRVERRGDEFWVEMDDPTSPPPGVTRRRIERQIVVLTGSHHEQDFWYSTGQDPTLEHFPFVYRIPEQRWVPDNSVFVTPPITALGEPQQWNSSCITCHATHGRQRVPTPEGVSTHVAEFGIACEACHGPAERHVRSNRNPSRRYEYHFGTTPDSSIINPSRLSHRRSAEVCGQCHGISYPTFSSDEEAIAWDEHGFRYRPGDALHESRLFIGTKESLELPVTQAFLQQDPTFLDDRFWPDGVVRVSGREYNGLLETGCFERGEMSCLSCHQMHKSEGDPRSASEWADDQLAPDMDGDEACLQCHDAFRADVEKHTHHRAESAGSRCYNCHMPHTTYGLLKAIRSHTVDSPNVEESISAGRPNACNLCHLDRTLLWTAQTMADWYEVQEPALNSDQKTIAASVLWALSGDAGQRALIAWHMGWEPARAVSGSDWIPPYLAHLLADPYDAVRFIAHRSLTRFPGFDGLAYDFVGSPREIQASAKEALRMWESTQRTEHAEEAGRAPRTEDAARVHNRLHDEMVLVDASTGTLDWPIYMRLAQARNNRRMHLKE